jgi:hypothetical protein
VGGADDDDGGPPFHGREPRSYVERRALAPARERGRGEEGVQGGGECPTFLGRKELVDGQRADFLEWRLGEIVEQSGKIGGLILEQPAFGEDREQDVFSALRGVSVATEQTQQERDRGAEGRARGLDVVLPAVGVALEGAQEVQRLAGGAPGRDHAKGAGLVECL